MTNYHTSLKDYKLRANIVGGKLYFVPTHFRSAYLKNNNMLAFVEGKM